jgi:hypothetical protein
MSVYQVVHGMSGCIYTITEKGDMCTVSWEDRGRGAGKVEYACRQVQDYLARGIWKRLADNACEEVDQPVLGVARPVLETRKVGKVRVELVDDGFPLALREVARVMTWAQTAKGYKDHDWQNLPDAEVQLAAAASRHRTDHIKQRVVEGKAITECVDTESALLHKAHEAFGVLAQLELMLRGEFTE